MNCPSTHRHRWHRVVNAACDAMKNWVCIVLLLVFVSDASADERSETLRVYFIGNSVTDTIRYESFAKLAESRDQSIVWGRHMIPGAPLEWIHSHADSGFMQEPFGHYPEALGDFVWDAVSVQPFDRQLHSNDADGGCHFYQPEGPFVPKDFVDPGHPAIYGDGAGLTLASCGKLVSQHLSTAICRLRGATAWLWRNHLYRRCSRLCRENH